MGCGASTPTAGMEALQPVVPAKGGSGKGGHAASSPQSAQGRHNASPPQQQEQEPQHAATAIKSPHALTKRNSTAALNASPTSSTAGPASSPSLTQRHSSAGSRPSGSGSGIPCDVDGAHVAILWCPDCEEHFCAPCDATLHARKKLKSHVRAPLPMPPKASASAATASVAPTTAAAAPAPAPAPQTTSAGEQPVPLGRTASVATDNQQHQHHAPPPAAPLRAPAQLAPLKGAASGGGGGGSTAPPPPLHSLPVLKPLAVPAAPKPASVASSSSAVSAAAGTAAVAASSAPIIVPPRAHSDSPGPHSAARAMSVTVTGIQPQQQQPQLQQRGIMRQRTVTVTPTAPNTAAVAGGVTLAPSSSSKAAPSSSPKQPKQASLLQSPLQRSTTTMSPGGGGGLGGGGGGGGLMRQSTFHKAAVAKKANPAHPPGESVLNSVPVEKLRTLAGSQLEMIWSQYDIDGNGVLDRKELALLANDCIARTLKMVEEEVRSANPSISPNDLREVVEREKAFILPGGTSAKNPAEQHQQMVRMLVRKLDVNNDGSVTKAELMMQWNSFSSQLFQVREQEALSCSIM